MQTVDELNKTRLAEEEQFITDALSDMMKGWVPLRMYLRMYPDETKRAVEARVLRGAWVRKVHYFAPSGSPAWVCLPAIQQWASGQDQ